MLIYHMRRYSDTLTRTRLIVYTIRLRVERASEAVPLAVAILGLN